MQLVVVLTVLTGICLLGSIFDERTRRRNGNSEITIFLVLFLCCVSILSYMIYNTYSNEYYIMIKQNGNEYERRADKLDTDDEWLYYDYEGKKYMIDKRNVEIRIEKKKWLAK